VGVQSFPFPNGDGTFDQYLAFAVNTYDRWSNASSVEFHVLIDVNNDGVPDYMVVGADQGAITTGVATGQLGAFVATLPDNVIVSENFLATAPTDSTVAILPILVSQLCEAGHPCLNATNPRFTYTAETIDLSSGKVDMVKGSAKFNAFSGAISFGGGGYVQALAPRGTDNSVSVQIDPAEAKLTRPKGVMVVNLDNKSGEQAELIDVDAGR
jgi:minor extracellular serine protease Vpr